MRISTHASRRRIIMQTRVVHTNRVYSRAQLWACLHNAHAARRTEIFTKFGAEYRHANRASRWSMARRKPSSFPGDRKLTADDVLYCNGKKREDIASTTSRWNFGTIVASSLSDNSQFKQERFYIIIRHCHRRLGSGLWIVIVPRSSCSHRN